MLDTFLDFSDASSYLISKHSGKRACTVSFELQMPQSSADKFHRPHFERLLQGSTKESKNLNHLKRL